MDKPLFNRLVIDNIARYLYTDDIIVVHGARQVGKTSILMYLQDQLQERGKSTFYIDLEDSRLTAILDQGVDEFLTHLREEGLELPAFIREDKKLFVVTAQPSSRRLLSGVSWLATCHVQGMSL